MICHAAVGKFRGKYETRNEGNKNKLTKKQSMSVVKLYLFRHGESQANLRAEELVTGRASNTPLTGRGEDQARKLGAHFRSTTFRSIFASTALRARSTGLSFHSTNHFILHFPLHFPLPTFPLCPTHFTPFSLFTSPSLPYSLPLSVLPTHSPFE